jgi:hypothetical protein
VLRQSFCIRGLAEKVRIRIGSRKTVEGKVRANNEKIGEAAAEVNRLIFPIIFQINIRVTKALTLPIRLSNTKFHLSIVYNY